MGRMSQRMVSKTDISVANLVSNGGYLNPEQSTVFIRKMLDVPTIIQQIRRVQMSAPIRNIDKIGFGSRILKKAPTSGTTLAASNRSAPTTEQVVLTSKPYMAEVNIPYDVLEDNIERGGLEGTIMSMITERVTLDIEELIITGDTTSSDEYLATLDGAIQQVSSHTVNFGALAETSMSKLGLKEMKKEMPTKYLRNLPAMRYFMSHNNEMNYRDTLADRETGLGDTMVEGFRPTYAYGVPVIPAALMPEANCLLTHPLNMIWGIQRQILVETDRDIRGQSIVVVVSIRMDFKFEEEDAVVLGTGITD